MDILTNPIVISVIVLVAMCLLKVNVFLAIIISSLLCAVLGGASLVEGITVFYENMGNDNRMVLFLLLLGVLAATMQYNNVGEVLAPRVAKLVGRKVWLFPIVLTLLAILVETFVLIGVSFLLVIVPPLLRLLNDYKIDRRLLVITTCCGLQMGYCCFPVGYGLAFMGIIQNSMAENGMEVSIDQIWKANLVIAIAMIIAIIGAMIKYRKPREYRGEDGQSAVLQAEKDFNEKELPPIEFKHIACLIAAASVVVVQLTTDSMPLAALTMILILVVTGAIKFKDFDSVFMKGIMTSVYVCLVLMAAVAFAAVSQEFGHIDELIAASAELIGGSKVFGAFFMLILGLIITIGSSPVVSMTTMRFKIPTWGAASPTPFASYMVSNISSMSSRSRGVISFTSLHFFVRMGSPIVLIMRIAIAAYLPFFSMYGQGQSRTDSCLLASPAGF